MTPPSAPMSVEQIEQWRAIWNVSHAFFGESAKRAEINAICDMACDAALAHLRSQQPKDDVFLVETLCPNGDIFVNGRLAANDHEVVDGLREWLLASVSYRSQAGSVSVPREPTNDMVQAGIEPYITFNAHDQSINGKLVRIYKAMLAASPPAGEDRRKDNTRNGTARMVIKDDGGLLP